MRHTTSQTVRAEETPLKAVPEDRTPDAGPVRRGGPLAWGVALSVSILTFGLGLALLREGLVAWAAANLALFGFIAAKAVWSLFDRMRCQRELPRSHAVLTDHLGFRIDFTCHDVAMTAFLDPDAAAAGQAATLLCFFENGASRQRVAILDIGPHPKLGLKEMRRVRLHLAAGQAALYAMPLRLAADLAAGEHDLPVTLRIERPTGTGVLLPGVRRHVHNLWTVHFAAPFTVQARGGDSLGEEKPDAGTVDGALGSRAVADGIEEPVYESLASVSDKAPDLGVLQRLSGCSR